MERVGSCSTLLRFWAVEGAAELATFVLDEVKWRGAGVHLLGALL
jgi:hypothetical protein